MNSKDMKHMKAAIQESRRSKAEDRRSHPKVGVVIVGENGREIGRYHRGQFLKGAEPGPHAEHVALEKLGLRTLNRATVYTTLEPCTTRNHPNIPCVKRLIERRVKRVVIGMLDPNPQILGLGWLALRDANIETELFPSHLTREIEELNRNFIGAQGSYHIRPRLLQGAAVYDQVIRMVKNATDSILVLTYSETPPAPMKFAHVLAKQLTEHETLHFDVVIGANLKHITKEFWAKSDERFAIYGSGGLSERVQASILDTNILSGFDVIIIDHKNVAIAFSTLPVGKQDKKQLALFMENDSRLATGLGKWFDRLKRSAKDYKVCRSAWRGGKVSDAMDSKKKTGKLTG
jgi:pyrimidine deaminase RibD-like protein